jgi:hypothetical protein
MASVPLKEAKEPKEQDLAPQLDQHPEQLPAQEHSDSDSSSDSSDEFDWDEEEDGDKKILKAKRGRAVWVAFMRLARPVRTILVGLIGTGILITPLLVFELRFKGSKATPHVHLWSLWLAITWAAGCLTSLFVDSIPRFIIAVTVLFGGQVERLKIQVELTLAVKGWLKMVLDISWCWIALAVLRPIYKPPGSYWVIVNRVMQASAVSYLALTCIDGNIRLSSPVLSSSFSKSYFSDS